MSKIPTNPASRLDSGDPFAGATVGCTSCTAPTERPDGLCAFCADPPPPLDDPVTDGLIRCANYTELARLDVDKLIDSLPAGTPLFAYADLVAAKAHLAAAVRKLDQAATRINEAVAQ